MKPSFRLLVLLVLRRLMQRDWKKSNLTDEDDELRAQIDAAIEQERLEQKEM